MNKTYAFHAPMKGFFESKEGRYYALMRVPKTADVSQAWLRSEPDNENRLNEMHIVSDDGFFQLWQGELSLNYASQTTLYCFKFVAQGLQQWLAADGMHNFFPDRELHFHFNPSYKAVPWLWSQVFYQIFPERFYDGDPSNNVKTGEYLYEGKEVVAKNWTELPDKRQGAREFFGGDLEGIRQKLDYLGDLGITALYLNPIFSSPSSHKYDTLDYYTVDKHFGGDEAFIALCHDLRARKMRLILDAVVNHTSERHPWFDRYGEHEAEQGAYQSALSPKRDFYTFHSDEPESYEGWLGFVKTLPVLNFASEALRNVVYKADDAILRYWMRPPYSIDGWRFDVMHMLGEGAGAKNNHLYARHFKETLREENPQAYMLGEHFYEATDWLQGSEEDGSMNYYGFTMPLRYFLAAKDIRDVPIKIDAKDFDTLLNRARARIPFEIQLSQFNLLDSHDTPRFLTVVGEDKALMKVAVSMLMTYMGVPCVYYGDEIGLCGEGDPDCRRPMPWDENVWDKDIQAHYKALIALRQQSQALQIGAYISLYAQGDVFAYGRILDNDLIIVALNRGEACEVDISLVQAGVQEGMVEDFFGGSTLLFNKSVLRVVLEAKSARVFIKL